MQVRSLYYNALHQWRVQHDEAAAERMFVQALEVNPRHLNCLKDYGAS